MELDGLLSVQLHDGHRKQLMPGMMLICLPLHSSTMLLERSMTQQTAVKSTSSKRSKKMVPCLDSLASLVELGVGWSVVCAAP